jgi:hypothetical protein
MFRRFLDATDYWFGYSDNSSAGRYDPARDCFVVLANDQVNTANMAKADDGEVPPGSGTGPHQGAGQAHPPHCQGAPTSTHNWLKRASSKPSLRRNTVRCGYFTPPSSANARAS